MNRRNFIKSTSAAGIFTLGFATSHFEAFAKTSEGPAGIGMCDWNLGGSASYEVIAKAKKVNLQGIQVSVGTDPMNIPLRSEKIRQEYINLGKEYNIKFNSVAAGGLLNKIPLATEPQSAVYVIDAIEAAAALGAKNILVAFFGNGDLRRKDLYDNMRDLGDGEYSSYELNTKHVQRVVEVLKQIAPRAEDAGVSIGLENTLSAKQNLDIIDQIGSDFVKVYYDVGNSWNYGYNVLGELKMLGNDMLCEVHLKDRKTVLLGSSEGEVNMNACAKVLNEINYDKWLVLETSGRKDKFEEDTKLNVDFVRKTFFQS